MFEEMKFSAAENLKLPKDVVLGEVLVSFLGRHSVVIEYYTNEEMKINGLIKSMEFE